MAVPKKKTSTSKKKFRNSQKKLTSIQHTTCIKCGKAIKTHIKCFNC
jgi:ribosomal protein L32